MTPPNEPLKGPPPQAVDSQAPVPAKAPSWISLLVGIWAVLMAAGLCAILTAHYLRSRPVQLAEVMRDHVGALESVLLANQVPRETIVLSAGELRSDESAEWVFLECRVDLPPTLILCGMERIVRKNMAQHDLVVLDETGLPAGTIVLHLQDSGREFARVILVGKPDKTNLSEATRRLAQEVSAILTQAVQPPATCSAGPPQSRENDTSEWTFTAMDVQLAPPVSVETVEAALSPILLHESVSLAKADDPATQVAALRITFSGLECVAVSLRQPPPAEQPAPEGAAAEAQASSMNSPENDADSESLPLDSEHLNGDARKQAPPLHKIPSDGTLQVAIIVDDGGYGGTITEELLSLDSALTLSILPNAPNSAETAQRAKELGFEVLLHMPMENSSANTAFPGQLSTGMAPEEIQKLTADALADVPGAVGVNNHTGSKFTSDPASMRAFLEVIKPLNLFFIDSRTISTTAAYGVAQEMDVPAAARDLFLDHESDKAYIRERFEQLIELCKTQGSAIGICHFRRNSVAVLREMLPRFAEEGITIVHVSELVE